MAVAAGTQPAVELNQGLLTLATNQRRECTRRRHHFAAPLKFPGIFLLCLSWAAPRPFFAATVAASFSVTQAIAKPSLGPKGIESKWPVRPCRQANPSPARHRPDARSARPGRWRFHSIADRFSGGESNHG